MAGREVLQQHVVLIGMTSSFLLYRIVHFFTSDFKVSISLTAGGDGVPGSFSEPLTVESVKATLAPNQDWFKLMRA